jgi:hypothetical protein
MKPRSIETERVRSLHSDFAPIGEERWVTPDEARFLIVVGRAELLAERDEQQYKHREMLTQRPRVRKG